MTATAASVDREAERLTALDSPIGDADHGSNLRRGFTAVTATLEKEAPATPGAVLTVAGRQLVSTVGGASGPLYGTLLRRAGNGDASSAVLRFADLELDLGTREVTRSGRSIELTRTEFSLLELFLRNARQVLTRSIIFERVWGYDFGPTSNSLDVYIGYLRRKTEEGGGTRLIHTVRGVGYALREP